MLILYAASQHLHISMRYAFFPVYCKLLSCFQSDSGELDTDRAAEIRRRHDFLRGQELGNSETVIVF